MRARSTEKEKGGWSKAVWGKLAEQGLLGLPFAEDDGGFGAGAVETMIVMEALGKALVLEPYLRDRRDRRRLPAPRRLGRAEGRAHSRHHRRQQDVCLRAAREELALRSRRCRHHRQEEGRRLGHRRRKIRRAQRRERRHADRHRAHQGRPARHDRHRRVPGAGQCQGRHAARAIRPRTACMPPTSPSPASRSARMPRSAIPRTAWR